MFREFLLEMILPALMRVRRTITSLLEFPSDSGGVDVSALLRRCSNMCLRFISLMKSAGSQAQRFAVTRVSPFFRLSRLKRAFFQGLQVLGIMFSLLLASWALLMIVTPLLFLKSLPQSADSPPMAAIVAHLEPYGVRPVAVAFGWVERRLDVPCVKQDGSRLVEEKCVEDNPFKYERLSTFEPILHTLFEFCIGLGLIIWLSKVGMTALRSALRFSSGGAVVEERYLTGLTGAARLRNTRRLRAEVVLAWAALASLGGVISAAYLCFILTALVTALLLTLVPFHPEFGIGPGSQPEYVAYAFAPLVETILLGSVVVISVGFRAVSPKGFGALSLLGVSEQALSNVSDALDEKLSQDPLAEG